MHVALGSHSLYTQGGDVEVDPFSSNQEPRNCGIFDGPGPVSPQPVDDDDGFPDLDPAVVIIAKFVAGLATGNFVQAPAAAEIEAVYQDTFVEHDGTWYFSERKLMVDWTETRRLNSAQ